MDVTVEKINTLIDLTLDKAKYNRESVGYKGEFAQCAIVIGPQAESAAFPMQWSSNGEKAIMMMAISRAAKDVNASAVMLITDVRWTDAERFCNYFHIRIPKESSVEEFQEEYGEIMRGIYGGSMANLPRELWNEALCVGCKGPLIGEITRIASYREGKNNTIEWIPDPYENADRWRVHMNLLPAWWTESAAV